MTKIRELSRPAAIPHRVPKGILVTSVLSLLRSFFLTEAAVRTWSPQKDPSWSPLKSTFRHSSWILETEAPKTELKQAG